MCDIYRTANTYKCQKPTGLQLKPWVTQARKLRRGGGEAGVGGEIMLTCPSDNGYNLHD